MFFLVGGRLRVGQGIAARALGDLSSAVTTDALRLDADPEEIRRSLLALVASAPGPSSMAMRAPGDRDAFPASDLGLRKAIDCEQPPGATELEALTEAGVRCARTPRSCCGVGRAEGCRGRPTTVHEDPLTRRPPSRCCSRRRRDSGGPGRSQGLLTSITRTLIFRCCSGVSCRARPASSFCWSSSGLPGRLPVWSGGA